MAGGIPITDPVELAWCEFARERADKGIPVAGCSEQPVSIASFKAGAEWERGKHLSLSALEKSLKEEERSACAELVRAASEEIFRPIREAFASDPKYIHKQDGGSFVRWGFVEGDVLAAIHALAERIEARGRG